MNQTTQQSQTDSAIESMQFQPSEVIRTPISMREFFALGSVKLLQEIQKANSPHSQAHKSASEEIVRIADRYCDDKGNSCASFF